MRRREFIKLIGCAAAWPLYAHAQPKLPIIGFLGPAPAAATSTWTAAFVQRLRELGWVEGRTVAIEYRWGDGRSDRLPEIAAEFVRLKVDLIVTTGTAVPALKKATSTIPIVFTIANDPTPDMPTASAGCPLSGIKQTLLFRTATFANDPKRTSASISVAVAKQANKAIAPRE